jgi:hypothetical protein
MIKRFTLPVLSFYVRRRLARWLRRLGDGLEPGRFAFCLKGNLVPVTGHAAHMSTIFAVKIAYQTGLLADWPQCVQNACITFLQSFQDEDGWVRDPWVLAYYNKHPDASPELQASIRAETRQLLSLLFTLGAKPLYAPPLEYDSPQAVSAFIRSLDWSNPWAAGSHWSHQAFLLAAAKAAGKDVSRLEAALLSLLDEYYNPECGLWFDPSQAPPPVNIQINGAMKVLTGLAWLPKRRSDHEALVRFCLNTLRLGDSCSLIDQIYVLQQTTAAYAEKSDLRREAKNAALRLARQSMRYYQRGDGAFSFYPGKAQTCYYAGIPASLGLQTADLHGSAMQTWALALVLQFFDGDEGCGWTTQRV